MMDKFRASNAEHVVSCTWLHHYSVANGNFDINPNSSCILLLSDFKYVAFARRPRAKIYENEINIPTPTVQLLPIIFLSRFDQDFSIDGIPFDLIGFEFDVRTVSSKITGRRENFGSAL